MDHIRDNGWNLRSSEHWSFSNTGVRGCKYLELSDKFDLAICGSVRVSVRKFSFDADELFRHIDHVLQWNYWKESSVVLFFKSVNRSKWASSITTDKKIQVAFRIHAFCRSFLLNLNGMFQKVATEQRWLFDERPVMDWLGTSFWKQLQIIPCSIPFLSQTLAFGNENFSTLELTESSVPPKTVGWEKGKEKAEWGFSAAWPEVEMLSVFWTVLAATWDLPEWVFNHLNKMESRWGFYFFVLTSINVL